MLPGRNDVEMGLANSLHASAYYSKYNERFDFEYFCWGAYKQQHKRKKMNDLVDCLVSISVHRSLQFEMLRESSLRILNLNYALM